MATTPEQPSDSPAAEAPGGGLFEEIYEAQVVPESRLVGNAPPTPVAKIDFRAPRPPLLPIAGAEDHIIPASLNRSNHGKYANSPSVTDFKEFPGRVHYLLAQAGWEEVADYALSWAEKQTGG